MKGSFYQSRRQSNGYNRLSKDEQTEHAKRWVATCEHKLLIPFINITGAAKYNREVFYEINIDRLLKVEETNKRYRRIFDHILEHGDFGHKNLEKAELKKSLKWAEGLE